MRGLDPRIHLFPAFDEGRWIAGSIPAMTLGLAQALGD
jgi:hypothetical protein